MSLLDRLKQLFAEAKIQAEPVPTGPTVEVPGAAEPVQERRRKRRVNALPGTKVLIIDDSPTIVLLLSRMLKQNKFNVLEAGDGESGLEIARRERPGLIFLDIVLPGMSGFTALRTLRHDPVTKDIPIIMISGNAQATEQFYVQRIGADNFMKKPFSRAEVFTYIERLLDEQFVPRRFNTYVHDTALEAANEADEAPETPQPGAEPAVEPAASAGTVAASAPEAAVTATAAPAPEPVIAAAASTPAPEPKAETPVTTASPIESAAAVATVVEVAAAVTTNSEPAAESPPEPAPAPVQRSIFEDINAGWRFPNSGSPPGNA